MQPEKLLEPVTELAEVMRPIAENFDDYDAGHWIVDDEVKGCA